MGNQQTLWEQAALVVIITGLVALIIVVLAGPLEVAL